MARFNGKLDTVRGFKLPPPKLIEILPGLTPETVGILAADGGTGKSFFGLQLAYSLAAGKPFADGLFAAQTPGRVVAFFAEDEKDDLLRRSYAVARAFPDLENGAENVIIPLIEGDVDLQDENTGTEIKEFTVPANQEPAKLVIFDPLCCFHSVDENNSTEMTKTIRHIRQIIRGTGAAALVMHHLKRDQKTVPTLCAAVRRS